MTLLKLFFQFIYVGFIAFGGGLATIPILDQLLVETNIIDVNSFYNMVAISQATPGPVGLNIATYVGYNRLGSIGAILTSIGISISSIICVSILARIFEKAKNNKTAIKMMKGIRAGSTGIIICAVLKLFNVAIINGEYNYLSNTTLLNNIKNILINVLNYKAIILFIVIYFIMKKTKKTPVIYILLGGLIGAFIF